MLLSTSTNKIKLEIFLKPFTRQTWYVFAVFGIFFIFIMKIIMNREDVGKREKYSDAIILSIGILSQQGKKVILLIKTSFKIKKDQITNTVFHF